MAWDILKDAEDIIVAKGKKFDVFVPSEKTKDAILTAAIGPSGNLRAPTLKIGKRFVIGFHAEEYAKIFG